MRSFNLILISTLSLLNMGASAQNIYPAIHPERTGSFKEGMDMGTFPIDKHQEKVAPSSLKLANERENQDKATNIPQLLNPAARLKSGVLHRAIVINEKRQVHNADYTSSSLPNDAIEATPAEPPHSDIKVTRSNFKGADELARKVNTVQLNVRRDGDSFGDYDERITAFRDDAVYHHLEVRQTNSDVAHTTDQLKSVPGASSEKFNDNAKNAGITAGTFTNKLDSRPDKATKLFQ